MLARSLLLIVALLSPLPALAQQTSRALADDESATEMQAALTAAQSVYVWGDLQNCFEERLIFHAQASALTTALTTWGRYRITPGLKGSYVVIEPTFSAGPQVCIIQVRDSQTLKVIGSFSEPRPEISRSFDEKFTAMTASLMDDLKALAGKSTAASAVAPPPPDLAPQEAAPTGASAAAKLSEKELTKQQAQELQNKLTAAHTVLLVDDTLWSSGQSGIGEPDEFALFQADMTAWGRYKFVQSAGAADLVVMVDDYMGCVRSVMVTGKLGPQCTPQIRLQVYDPASLDFVTQVIVAAKTAKPRPGKPDPFAASVQAMTDQLRSAAGDTAAKHKTKSD